MRINKNIAILLIILLFAFVNQINAGTKVDNFNRADLGLNWTADPQYQIVSNTLSNTSTTPTWEFLAVYNAVENPFEVSFRWAGSANEEGANSGGIAIYLDNAATNANGYFVMRRYGSIDLNPIENGVVNRTNTISSTASTLSTPQPGDVVKVIASTDGLGHHFDFYLNGVFDGRVSDTSKLYGNVSTKYAGVCLFGNRQNNIDDFTVKAPMLEVTSPNGGESWVVNTTHSISWTTSDFSSNVKIELSIDSGATWTTVAGSVANTGSYTWTVNNSPSTLCRIRISDAADGSPKDISDSDFTIEPATPEITLLSPNGGENWIINTTQDITWQANMIDYIRIDYSIDNGANWINITTSTENDGSYSWTIPSQVTDEALVRVKDAVLGTYVDQSESVFSISALVTLTVPEASGDPGDTNSVVNVWMNNQTNVRGVLFRLTDAPNNLTARLATPVGRASSFTTSFSDEGNYVQVIMVSISGSVIPVGNGPIVHLTYRIDPAASVGDSSWMNLSNVSISDANMDEVEPNLVNGKFYYVKKGDLIPNGVVDSDDVDLMVTLVLGTNNPTHFELLAGDMDNDGDIDMYDLLEVFDLVP